jgi:hypothetical protein
MAEREFPQAKFDRVHELVNLVKERILYFAIAGLYTALGEPERLEKAQTPSTQQ